MATIPPSEAALRRRRRQRRRAGLLARAAQAQHFNIAGDDEEEAEVEFFPGNWDEMIVVEAVAGAESVSEPSRTCRARQGSPLPLTALEDEVKDATMRDEAKDMTEAENAPKVEDALKREETLESKDAVKCDDYEEDGEQSLEALEDTAEGTTMDDGDFLSSLTDKYDDYEEDGEQSLEELEDTAEGTTMDDGEFLSSLTDKYHELTTLRKLMDEKGDEVPRKKLTDEKVGKMAREKLTDEKVDGMDLQVMDTQGVAVIEGGVRKVDGTGDLDLMQWYLELSGGRLEKVTQDKWAHKWKGQMSSLTAYDDGTVVAGGVYLEMVDRIKGALMTVSNPGDVLLKVEGLAKEIQGLAEVHMKIGQRAEARRLITDGIGFARLSKNLAGRLQYAA